MKKKMLIIGSLVLILVFGFLYTFNSNLIADDKDPKNKKDCSSQCTDKTGSSSSTNKTECPYTKTGSSSSSTDDKGYSKYEFVTDKISCDGCKPEMSEKLMGIQGVKEVIYDPTNSDTKLTNVQVLYSATDTTPDIIAASIKEKGLTGHCEDGSKCESKKNSEKKL